MNLLDKIKQNPEEISFDEVIAYIDEHYDFVPTAFQNGEVLNEENQNNGSCKIFSFAKKLGLNEKNTLFLFGNFYRKDVLGDLQGTNHQNIRNFMKTGWEGINFHRESLLEK